MLEADGLTITDPVWEEPEKKSFFARIFGQFVRDERDLPFVALALKLSLIFVPLAVLILIPSTFSWWLSAAYWALYLWFLGPFVLMLHNTSHRILFKREYDIGNKYIPWVVGFFFGQTPETYFAHHMGMHHREGNLHDDLSSTMKYRRDNFLHFLHYYLNFLFFGLGQLALYFFRSGRKKMATRLLFGEFVYLAVGATVTYFHWQAGVTLFVVPLVVTRFLLMAGNWTQHAFVDPDLPDNDYASVTSFINSTYNHRCFNDGYHLGHHLKSSRHWLEMPEDWVEKRDEMIAHDSIVFEKVDYFIIWLLLMTRQKRILARYFVQLDPENPKSEEEILALFERRLQPIR